MLRDAPPVSVLTIHHGPAIRLDRLGHALVAQTYPLDRITWVVVDDASPEHPDWWPFTPDQYSAPGLQTGDESSPLLASVALPADSVRGGQLTVHAVQHPTNRGRMRARNEALRHVEGEIVLWLDSDMEPVSTWLETMVRAAQRTGGVVVGGQRPHPRLERTAFLRYATTRGAMKRPTGERIPGRYFATGNSAMTRGVAEQIGPFPEDLTGWGGEDLDYGMRLEDAGIPLFSERRAWAWHDHQVSWEQQEQRYRDYGTFNVPVLIARHPQLHEELNLNGTRINTTKGCLRGMLKPLLLRAALRPRVFNLLRTLVTRYPRSPWPDLVFDFLIYYLYSLPHRQPSQ